MNIEPDDLRQSLERQIQRAVEAIPQEFFRSGEPWETALALLCQDRANMLTSIRRVDQKYGPYDEFSWWRDSA